MSNTRRLALVLLLCMFAPKLTLAQTSDGSMAVAGTATPEGFNLRVMEGDTLLNLFGNDWEKVYRTNCAGLFRDGAYVSSPTFLVEGAVLWVSNDTYLSPRAQSRVIEISQQRDQLHSRLALLENAGGDIGNSATELDAKLAGESYVADLQYLAHQTDLLESSNRQRLTEISMEQINHDDDNAVEGLIVGVAAVLVMAAWLWAALCRRKIPSGDERLVAALRAVDRLKA